MLARSSSPVGRRRFWFSWKSRTATRRYVFSRMLANLSGNGSEKFLSALRRTRLASRRRGLAGYAAVAGRCRAGQALGARAAGHAPGEADLLADRLQRLWVVVHAEAQLEDPPLPLGKRVQQAPRLLPPQQVLHRVGRVGRRPVKHTAWWRATSSPSRRCDCGRCMCCSSSSTARGASAAPE